MNYIIIYLEVKHLLNFLTTEQKGELLEVLMQYAETNKLPECCQNVLNVFNFLKPRIDEQKQKAERKSNTSRNNGKLGGRPALNKKPSKTQPKPKKTQWVSATETKTQIPDFIDSELWNGFLDVRKKLKAPPTEMAFKLILNKLEGFENKKIGNANEALRKSIENNWRGVFEPEQAFSKTGNFKNKTQRNLEILQNTKLT